MHNFPQHHHDQWLTVVTATLSILIKLHWNSDMAKGFDIEESSCWPNNLCWRRQRSQNNFCDCNKKKGDDEAEQYISNTALVHESQAPLTTVLHKLVVGGASSFVVCGDSVHRNCYKTEEFVKWQAMRMIESPFREEFSKRRVYVTKYEIFCISMMKALYCFALPPLTNSAELTPLVTHTLYTLIKSFVH